MEGWIAPYEYDGEWRVLALIYASKEGAERALELAASGARMHMKAHEPIFIKHATPIEEMKEASRKTVIVALEAHGFIYPHFNFRPKWFRPTNSLSEICRQIDTDV